MSFNYLKKHDIGSEPVEYPLYQIGGEPVLLIRPAGEKNKPYHNALLKRNAKLAARFRAGTKVNREMMKENREHDRALYGKFIIAGWEGIVDDSGVEVAFSPEVCSQFLRSLPDWIFDDIRQFAGSAANFLADDEPDTDEIEETAGN